MAEKLDTNESLREITARLMEFEQRYGLSTLQFYPQFLAG